MEELFKDQIPEDYSMMGLVYCGDNPNEYREAILKKHPEAKFSELTCDDIHEYRFFAWLPGEICQKNGYPKFIS